jgi:hypothetical protein
MEQGNYLALEYGEIRNPLCNVHRSRGTLPATRLHYHDFYQIYLLVKGALRHETPSDAQVLYSGDCFVIPPAFPHRIRRLAEDTEFYAFSFRREFLWGAADPAAVALLETLTPGDARLKISLSGTQLSGLEQLLEYSLKEFTAQQPGWETAVRGILTAVLVLLSREAPEPADQGIRECVAYLDAHISQPICLADLLQRCHLSASTFYRSFRAFTFPRFITSNTTKTVPSLRLSPIKKGFPQALKNVLSKISTRYISPANARSPFLKPCTTE